MNWEAYAIRYGRHERTAQTNFLLPVPDAHEAMPLDYFIWLLRAPDGREARHRLPHETYLGLVAAANMKQRVRKLVEYHHAERLHRAVAGTPNRLE